MKLLGVQFERFACFDTVFVPLDRPILLLVGKNNSGKTALLRGLSALSALPFPGRSQLLRELAGYLQSAEGPNSFRIGVWFEWEQSDGCPFRGSPELWKRFVETEKPRAQFSFRVWPNEGAAAFDELLIHYSDRALKILERRPPGGAISQTTYEYNGTAVDGKEFAPNEPQQAPDKSYYSIHRVDDFFSGFVNIRRTLTVEAHRVVQSSYSVQNVPNLRSNANELAPFLLKLFGDRRDQFEEIEQTVTHIFPEFIHVNPKLSEHAGVTITLTLRKNGEVVALDNCGTGVEQFLSLATFAVTAKSGTTVLIDEPHSFLHPRAERQLIDLLKKHSKARYVISTHSAVLINSIPADSILSLPQERPSPLCLESTEHADILSELGYRNSDLLFSDRIIFVEGPSDTDIIPSLLRSHRVLDAVDIRNSGFPSLDGSGKLKARKAQTSILYYERMLMAMGRAKLPRLYLLDGDFSPSDVSTLTGTMSPATGEHVKIVFLPRTEVENYLLVPSAITAGIREQACLLDMGSSNVLEADVTQKLQDLLKSPSDKLFPHGSSGDCLKAVKGSKVLEEIFSAYSIEYNKRISGNLIARHISTSNQPALAEIFDLVKDLFPA